MATPVALTPRALVGVAIYALVSGLAFAAGEWLWNYGRKRFLGE
jgi:hypothetical protein